MAVSGTTVFTATRNDIISGALKKITVIPAGVPIQPQMLVDASFTLNAMVKHWGMSQKAIHVWTVEEAILFVQPGRKAYTVGTSGTAKATDAGAYTQVQVTANALAGAGSILVDSIVGILSGDQIGITLDDGTIHWTTVNGAPAGSTVTLTAVLTDDVAENNFVWVYTNTIVQPLKITAARRLNVDSGFVTPLEIVSRKDYQDYPNKDDRGTVTSLTYDRQLSTSKISLWVSPSDIINNHVLFTWQRPIMDFNTAADNPDLPTEWVQTLIWNLALQLCEDYETPAAKIARIKTLADEYLADMVGGDFEDGSIFIQPDYSGRR